MHRVLGELTIAGLAIAAAIAGYRVLAGPDLDPGATVPHAFGVLGVLLMLWAELAHSLRRRSRAGAHMPARVSLSAHVVAGLVGPALVLLHTGWHLRGLAGAVTVMMLVVVASGAVGRCLYPAVGDTQPSGVRSVVAAWHAIHVPLATATLALALVHVVAALYFGVGLR